MIQFNLLPDVKLAYIKAQRAKHLVLFVATVIAGSALGVFILLFVAVRVLQRQHINNLTQDIKRDSKTLQQKKDIDKILTIQNQLKSLPDLHSKKPAATRFYDFVGQLTPNKVMLGNVIVGFTDQTMVFTGSAESLADINKYVDTFKFTTFKEKGAETVESDRKAFSQVVLTSFGKDQKIATFQISLKFDPAIYDNSKEVVLVVPPIISTRSQTEKPADLFGQNNEQKQ